MSFRLDIHVHTSELSPCSSSTAEEMCAAAVRYGINGICFTDHHKYMPHERLDKLRAAFPQLWLIRGIEVTVPGTEDIIVLGVDVPSLEERGIEYNELHALVRQQNGFMSLAHPFRYHSGIQADVTALPPDTVEIHSKNTGACDEEQIRDLAQNIGIPTIHASDAHQDIFVGIYHIAFTEKPQDEQELISLLKAGAFTREQDQERIDNRNKEMEAIETEIKQLLTDGVTREQYVELKGGWGGFYDRVKRGKSYRI